MSSKSVLQKCQTSVSSKSVSQEWCAIVSSKSVLPECQIAVSCQGVPQLCPVEHVTSIASPSTYVSACGFVGFILFCSVFKGPRGIEQYMPQKKQKSHPYHQGTVTVRFRPLSATSLLTPPILTSFAKTTLPSPSAGFRNMLQ